jgi:DNA-directed RNA polymerase specialized sigma24 family protein
MIELNNLKKSPYSESDALAIQLLSDFKEGDGAAFSKLYDLHVNMLYNYGCRLTTDVELLKDCIQDVFIKIYNKRLELDAVANFRSYLLISLKNKLCDESRKRVHLSDVAVDELDVISCENIENRVMLQSSGTVENSNQYTATQVD